MTHALALSLDPMDDDDTELEELAEDAAPARSKKLARVALDKAFDKAMPGASEELRGAATEVISPWVERYVRVFDDWLRIPGTKVGVGLDPILGMVIPGAGDVVTGIGSAGLLLLALKHRVPTVIIGKMLLNILVDVAGGFLPIVGDAFDVLWRSNRRNLELIEEYKGDTNNKPKVRDYVLVGVGLVLAALSVAIPIFIVYGIGLGAFVGLRSLFG